LKIFHRECKSEPVSKPNGRDGNGHVKRVKKLKP